MGGALTTLCVMDLLLHQQKKVAAAYTYGSPRVGNPQVSQSLSQSVDQLPAPFLARPHPRLPPFLLLVVVITIITTMTRHAVCQGLCGMDERFAFFPSNPWRGPYCQCALDLLWISAYTTWGMYIHIIRRSDLPLLLARSTMSCSQSLLWYDRRLSQDNIACYLLSDHHHHHPPTISWSLPSHRCIMWMPLTDIGYVTMPRVKMKIQNVQQAMMIVR